MSPLPRTLLIACCFVATGALAQEQDPPLEEVLVLGSHIPRGDYTSISPVFTLSPEDLALEHRETIAELLNRYPQFLPDRTATSADFNDRPGQTYLNMRGLGTQRNLVLIDGRRVGPSGARGSVDVNMLPAALLEQVEILTGGASSTYGADAMSGVVNFKLRRNIEGIELGGSFERTDQGDGDTSNLFALAGTEFAGGKGQLSGFLSHFERQGILRSERAISAQVIQENWSDGSLYEGGSVALPAGYFPAPAQVGGELAPNGFSYDASGDPVVFQQPEDLYNFNEQGSLTSDMERTGLGLFAHYNPGEHTVLDASLVHTQNTVDLQYAPAPAFLGNLLLNLNNPLLSVANRETLASNFDPQNRGFVVQPYYYQAMQAGNRKQKDDSESTWLNLEASGRLLDDWQWTAAYTYSDYDMELEQKGGVLAPSIRQAVLVDPATGDCFDTSGGCQPADIFGPGRLSEQALSFISAAPYLSTESTRQQVASLRANGFFDISQWTDIGLAIGLEWREDESRNRPDPRLLQANSFRVAQPITGEDDVTEAYGEMLLPLLRERKGAQLLELELGARFSDYSKIGEEWTWKAGTNWVPIDGLRLRASFNRAARAPNMQESYTPLVEVPIFGLGANYYDPCAASNRPQDTPGRAELCISQGIDPANLPSYEPPNVFQHTDAASGNLELETEVADTYTLGLVWTPPSITGLSVTLDYYDIEITDYIRAVNSLPAFNLCFAVDQKFCQGIERAPEGQVTRFFGTFYNTEGLLTNGVDLALSYTWSHQAPWAWPSSLGVSVAANWLDSFELAGNAGSWECAGRFGSPCSAAVRPEYRSLSRIHYNTGPLSATLSWQWLDGVENAGELLTPPGAAPAPQAVPELGSENYFDFTLGWLASERLSLNFTVINLTDTNPPLLGRNASGANTNPATYDVLGRRYQASFALRF